MFGSSPKSTQYQYPKHKPNKRSVANFWGAPMLGPVWKLSERSVWSMSTVLPRFFTSHVRCQKLPKTKKSVRQRSKWWRPSPMPMPCPPASARPPVVCMRAPACPRVCVSAHARTTRFVHGARKEPLEDMTRGIR